ncbi:ABC transporter G family member 25 isoform X2 [Actinidia eriantha]|uniref:ABC transporter G family member 25 isoform X2 n=1 Tax=Actinidia eriantha TaxID=165200 RepID=UPI00258F56CF|nr:ABC transporter G family member 25 isoform X2 [Actinidia eriantha]
MPAFRRDQETPNPDPEEPNDPSPPNSHDLQSIMSSCYPITLQFMDVCYNVKLETRNTGVKITHMLTGGPTGSITERTILNGITGMVSPGQILAVLGPSGSGKSTLLSALAGRLQGHGFTGSVLANGKKLTKPVLKRTGFVPQDDVLYPHLTVRETLIFISLLRLPNTLSKNEKTSIADSVISELGLGKCGNTIIGNSFIRGVSGGERKRVSIAHEMLINPSLLVLDEPTSGLDATAAHRLVATLGRMAEKGRRTVVMSVHQPSSRVYQMFNSALVLAEGRCIYFGKGSEAMAYFESVGFSPSFPMNPADFLLDLANGVCHVDGVTEREKPNVKQSLVASYNNLLAPKVKAACMDPANTTIQRDNTTKGTHISRESKGIKITTTISNWFHQFTILLRRSLKERRHEAFNSLRVFQVLAASMLAGSMWWRSDMRDVQDRLGLLFFISIFWGVLPSFNAVFAFPQERAIFMKERASGLGLALGALIMDAKQASTLVTVTMLAFVLTGGFYVHNVPACMVWMKYISTTFYCYRLLINVQYGEGKWISSLLGCSRHGSNHNHASCRFIEEDVEGQIHPVVSMGMLLFMLVGYRLLAYVALRRIKA